MPPARLPSSVEAHYLPCPSDGNQPSGRWLTALLDLLRWADSVFLAGELAFCYWLAAAAKEARFGLRRGFAQALVSAPFLCGRGACQCCSVDTTGGRRQACLSGPVFDLVEIAP